MKKFSIIIALLFAAATVQAQNASQGEIIYTPVVIKSGNNVDMSLDIDINGMMLKRQHMIVIDPAVVAADGSRSVAMPEVVIAGPKRYKAIKRSIFYHKSPFNDQTILVRYNNLDIRGAELRDGKIHIRQSAEFSEWMRNDASFVVEETVAGCVKCVPSSTDKVIMKPVLAPLFVPQYKTTYITPPVETIKQRSETYLSRLNYVVGRSNLQHDYKNNAAVLNEVDKIMSELSNDKNLTISQFNVTGYASPEGSAAGNQRLSEARAKSFLDYLHSKYGLNVSSVHSEGRGEDWDGLYKEVSGSNSVPDKDKVLSIIKNTSNDASRKSQLQALGSTYRYLLDNLYPPLRRNEYEISYVARAFNVDEAKQIIKTKPQLLSLNEMFLVANSYPKNSEEFKNVFDVAVRMYPNDNTAKLNAAAMEIETGAVDQAIQRLTGMDTPEAWNNLGVAYAKKGDSTNAEQYLRRAANAGQTDARSNLEQFEKWKAEN